MATSIPRLEERDRENERVGGRETEGEVEEAVGGGVGGEREREKEHGEGGMGERTGETEKERKRKRWRGRGRGERGGVGLEEVCEARTQTYRQKDTKSDRKRGRQTSKYTEMT